MRDNKITLTKNELVQENLQLRKLLKGAVTCAPNLEKMPIGSQILAVLAELDARDEKEGRTLDVRIDRLNRKEST